MNPFRTQVKFFLEKPENLDTAAFAPVFQRWIQQNLLNELLIDVADYRHVFEGPGIVLIGDASDYAIESRGGRIGLLYTRKRQREANLPEQLRAAFQHVLTAAELLEAETTFDPRLKFNAEDIEIRFADRLQLPNSAEAYDQVKDELQAVLSELAGMTVKMTPVKQDARHLLTIDVHRAGTAGIGDWLQAQRSAAKS